MGTENYEEKRRREEREEEFRRQLEEEKERKIEIARRNLEFMVENNKRMNRQIVQDSQDALDNQRRKLIIESGPLVGYHLDPYSMSSSELEYWFEKIQSEIEIKRREILGY